MTNNYDLAGLNINYVSRPRELPCAFEFQPFYEYRRPVNVFLGPLPHKDIFAMCDFAQASVP